MRGQLIFFGIALLATPFVLAQLTDKPAQPTTVGADSAAPMGANSMPQVRDAAATINGATQSNSPEALEKAIRQQTGEDDQANSAAARANSANDRASADKARNIMREQLLKRSQEERHQKKRKASDD